MKVIFGLATLLAGLWRAFVVWPRFACVCSDVNWLYSGIDAFG